MGVGGSRIYIDHASGILSTSFNGSPNRSAVSSADSVDISALATTLISVGNHAVLNISCEFSTTGANAIIVPICYDSAGTFMFTLSDMTFYASGLRRTASGNYVAPAQMVDTFGASSIRLMIKSISGGNVTVYGGVI